MTWMIDPPTYADEAARAAGVDARCNGRRAPLMHIIARGETGVPVGDGWIRIVRERAASLAGIKPVSVKPELQQMVGRKTLELIDLGDGDYKVRITALGIAMLEEEGVI